MEKVVNQRPLREEECAPLIEDPDLALRTFEEILKRGQAFYPDYGTAEEYPRVYRIIPLAES